MKGEVTTRKTYMVGNLIDIGESRGKGTHTLHLLSPLL